MKKLLALTMALTALFCALLYLAGHGQIRTVNLALPFEAEAITSVEMYRCSGTPVSAEKKTVSAEEDIRYLYDQFAGLSLVARETEDTAAATTGFRFNLTDGTRYELIYSHSGVPTGSLKSMTDHVEYLTSADIGSYWSHFDLEAVPAEESELPK